MNTYVPLHKVPYELMYVLLYWDDSDIIWDFIWDIIWDIIWTRGRDLSIRYSVHNSTFYLLPSLLTFLTPYHKVPFLPYLMRSYLCYPIMPTYASA